MKLIEKIKKHDNIIVFIIITIIVSSIVFFTQTDSNDELWNFSNIYKMVNGYTIYKDINVIITPLFFLIGKIFFEIFGANYFVYRILQAIIHTTVYFLIYQLFKALKIRKLNSVMYLLGIMFVYRENMVGTGSYNQLAIAFYILGIIFLIKDKYKPNINAIIQGIIIFLIFITKQNLAVYYIIASIIYNILTKQNIKETIKFLFMQLSTSFILLITFLFVLYLNNNLYNFLNYTVLGINEFAKENTVIPIGNLIIVLLQLTLLVMYFILANIKKIPFEEKIRKNIKLLTIFSVMIILFAYPIFNLFHIYVEAILTIILTLYIIDNIIVETLLRTKSIDLIKKVFITIIIGYFVFIWINNNRNYIEQMYKEDINSPYFGAILTQEQLKEIDEIVQYIKYENERGNDVKIISHYANFYMNILKKSNGAMDLPFHGNFGSEGVEGVIRQIQQLKNTRILITKEKDESYQESEKLREYIQNNLKQKGEIGRFLIY